MKRFTTINTLYLLSLILCNGTVLSGQVSLSIEASRLSGVAPLYVFFDATETTGMSETNDLVNADFSWDFDYSLVDSTVDKRFTKGMVVGHVFTCPGSYKVQCIVRTQSGGIDTSIIDIEVSSYTGTTYYVSEAGSDLNDGLTELSAFQNPQHAIDMIVDTARILFARGDTFYQQNLEIENQNSGRIILESYGEGNKPILSGIAYRDIISIQNSSDIVITNLQIGLRTVPYSRGVICEESSHVLVHNTEITASGSMATNQDESDTFCVSSCYLHHTGVMGIFSGSSTRFSWIHNSIDSLLGTAQPEHVIRVQGGEKQFIAHNKFTNIIDTKTTITIRGDSQRHVMIYDNKMDRILEVNPTGASTVQAISQVTIESNYIGQNPDYVGSIREPTTNGINIEATHIAVRNNIIDGYVNAINVSHDYNGVVSGVVDVYHNTVNWRPVSPQSGSSGRIVRVRDVSDVNVYNNVIYAQDTNQVNIITNNDNSVNISADNNRVLSTPQLLNQSTSSAADQNNISYYELADSSALINAAIDTFFTYSDIAHNSRRLGATSDIGAWEYSCDGERLELIAPLLDNRYEAVSDITITGAISDTLVLYGKEIILLPYFNVPEGNYLDIQLGDCTSQE